VESEPPAAGAAPDGQGGSSALVVPAGSEQAFEAWYRDHGTAVYRFVRFQVGSADEAEDLTADIFLRALRAAERYDPALGEVRTWLFGIARNAVRDSLRRLRVRRHQPLGAMRDLACEAPSPEERLLWAEQVGHLLDAVSQLSRADREVISLRYGAGLDAVEAARTLGIGQSAFRTRLWRALGRLRVRLEALS
jgi:RNA polymerase sigma-70 factor (ECF subfamily)